MKAELKQKWIEALRGGEYAQGVGSLCTETYDGRAEHCCLGVLAEVMGLEREYIMDQNDLDDIERSDVLGPWSADEATDPGFESGDEKTHTTCQRRLAAMNDIGKTFEEIADYIEANIPAESDSTGASES